MSLMKYTMENSWLAALLIAVSGCAMDQPIRDPEFEVEAQQPAFVKPPERGTIYSEANNHFLFEDIKARRVGDLLTVILDERTQATKSASTNTSKNTTVAMPSPTLLGVVPRYKGREFMNNSARSDLAFNGGADSSQSNELSGSLTVMIVDKMPNGNLVVRGEKVLTLNQGSEVVRISGVVRPVDIAPDNTLLSTHIAASEITYSGNGPLAESNTPGWLTRLLGSALWPF